MDNTLKPTGDGHKGRKKLIFFGSLGGFAIGLTATLIVGTTLNKTNNDTKGVGVTSSYSSVLGENVIPEMNIDWSQYDVMKIYSPEIGKYNSFNMSVEGINQNSESLQFFASFPSDGPINRLAAARTTELISTNSHEKVSPTHGLEQYRKMKTDSFTSLKDNNVDSIQLGTINGQLMYQYLEDGNIHLADFDSNLAYRDINDSEISSFINDNNTKTVAINAAGRAVSFSSLTNVIFYQYLGQKKFGLTSNGEVVYEVAVMDPESSKKQCYLLTESQMVKYGKYVPGDEKGYSEKLDFENMKLFPCDKNEKSYDLTAAYKSGDKLLVVTKDGMKIETNIKNAMLFDYNYDGNISPTETDYDVMFLQPKYNVAYFLMNKQIAIDGFSFIYDNNNKAVGYEAVDKDSKTRYYIPIDDAIPCISGYGVDSSYTALDNSLLVYNTESYAFQVEALGYKPCPSNGKFTAYAIQVNDSETSTVLLSNDYITIRDNSPENNPIFSGSQKNYK